MANRAGPRRAVGPATESAAITEPSASRIGAATAASPISSSSTMDAKPRRRVVCSSRSS